MILTTDDQGLCNQNLKEKSVVMKVNRTKVILCTAMETVRLPPRHLAEYESNTLNL